MQRQSMYIQSLSLQARILTILHENLDLNKAFDAKNRSSPSLDAVISKNELFCFF